MRDTVRIDQDTDVLYRPPQPRGQVPVPPTRSGSPRPPADWGRRSQIALFVFLCLLIANVAVADLLAARGLLGWHW